MHCRNQRDRSRGNGRDNFRKFRGPTAWAGRTCRAWPAKCRAGLHARRDRPPDLAHRPAKDQRPAPDCRTRVKQRRPERVGTGSMRSCWMPPGRQCAMAVEDRARGEDFEDHPSGFRCHRLALAFPTIRNRAGHSAGRESATQARAPRRPRNPVSRRFHAKKPASGHDCLPAGNESSRRLFQSRAHLPSCEVLHCVLHHAPNSAIRFCHNT